MDENKKIKRVRNILIAILVVVIILLLIICIRCCKKEDNDTVETIETQKKEYILSVSSNNSQYGSVMGSGTYTEGKSVEITASAQIGYYFEKWDDGNTEIKRTVIVDSNKSFKAIFKEGICIRYNEASITVVNGTISDNGDYFLIKPNNSKSFGYWYKNEDIGTIANDFKSENVKIYKNDLKGNVKYTALDSLTGYAMFSLENDDYDVATRFSELLTSSSFEDFIVNTTIPYYDYGYYNYQTNDSKNTTLTLMSENNYKCDTVVGIKENGVAFVSVKLVLVEDEIRALYPIVQPYMGMEGATLESTAKVEGITYNYLINFEIR